MDAIAALLIAAPVAAYAQELPVSVPRKEVLSDLAIGMELETLPGGYVVVSPSTTLLGQVSTDPNYRIALSRQIAVYAPLKDATLRQIVVVHHEPGDRLLAQKIARLAARLLRLHNERFGRETTFPQGEELAHLWLSRAPAVEKASIAGETRVNHVYFYRVKESRSALEWARILTHEWGHLTLPAARGFREPEGDAAGFLGERLYLRWLFEDIGALPRKFDDFVEREGLQLYYDRQISPLIARYNAAGPTDPRLKMRDAAAMDYYIGMALAADVAFGSKVVGFALYHTEDVTPGALVNAVRNGVFLEPELKTTLPAWVPFASDTYTVLGTAGKVSIDVRTLDPARPVPFKVLSPGFKLVKGTVPMVTIRRGAPKK